MVSLMDRLLKLENLDLHLTPYRVLATGQDEGLLEFIPSSSLAQVNDSIRSYWNTGNRKLCVICPVLLFMFILLNLFTTLFDNLILNKSPIPVFSKTITLGFYIEGTIFCLIFNQRTCACYRIRHQSMGLITFFFFFFASKRGNLVPWLIKSQELRIYFLGLWVFYFIDIVTILLVLQVIIKEWPGHDNLQSPFQRGTPRIGEGLQVCVE